MDHPSAEEMHEDLQMLGIDPDPHCTRESYYAMLDSILNITYETVAGKTTLNVKCDIPESFTTPGLEIPGDLLSSMADDVFPLGMLHPLLLVDTPPATAMLPMHTRAGDDDAPRKCRKRTRGCDREIVTFSDDEAANKMKKLVLRVNHMCDARGLSQKARGEAIHIAKSSGIKGLRRENGAIDTYADIHHAYTAEQQKCALQQIYPDGSRSTVDSLKKAAEVILFYCA